MERHLRETAPQIDFLNEKMRVSFEIAPEMLKHIPTISNEDRRLRQERFGILLGTGSVEKNGNNMHLLIKGVYQEDKNEQNIYGTYKEGVEEVLWDPFAVKKRIANLQRTSPEYRGFHFLGDIHTHPSSLHAIPSEQDIKSIIKMYRDGLVSNNEPYIFGITGTSAGIDEHNFYRLVRTGNAFGYRLLEHKD